MIIDDIISDYNALQEELQAAIREDPQQIMDLLRWQQKAVLGAFSGYIDPRAQTHEEQVADLILTLSPPTGEKT